MPCHAMPCKQLTVTSAGIAPGTRLMLALRGAPLFGNLGCVKAAASSSEVPRPILARCELAGEL